MSDEDFFLLVQEMGGVQKDEKECKSHGVLSDSYSLLKIFCFHAVFLYFCIYRVDDCLPPPKNYHYEKEKS